MFVSHISLRAPRCVPAHLGLGRCRRLGLQLCRDGAGTEPAVAAGPGPAGELLLGLLPGLRAAPASSPARTRCQSVRSAPAPGSAAPAPAVGLDSLWHGSPRSPSAQMWLCDSPALMCAHGTAQLLSEPFQPCCEQPLPGPAPALPTPPCCRLLSFTHSVLSWLRPFPPLVQPGSFFGSLPPALPGLGQRRKSHLSSAASMNQGRVSSGIHPATSHPCPRCHGGFLHAFLHCHCSSNNRGQHKSKSHETPMVQGVVLSVCVPCSNSQSSWLLQITVMTVIHAEPQSPSATPPPLSVTAGQQFPCCLPPLLVFVHLCVLPPVKTLICRWQMESFPPLKHP